MPLIPTSGSKSYSSCGLTARGGWEQFPPTPHTCFFPEINSCLPQVRKAYSECWFSHPRSWACLLPLEVLSAGRGGTCLWLKHLGSRDQRISEFEASLVSIVLGQPRLCSEILSQKAERKACSLKDKKEMRIIVNMISTFTLFLAR